MNGWLQHLPILPVLLPLLAAALLLLPGESRRGTRAAMALTATLAQLAVAIILLGMADGRLDAAWPGDIAVYALGGWAPPFGIVLVVDRLAAVMLVLSAALALAALTYSLARWERAGTHYLPLFQLLLMGLNGAFLTGDLFNLFVFFEILLLASYGLLLHGGGRQRVKAGLHYVVINLVGSTLFLFAVGTLYGVTGTLNMADLAVKLAATPPENAALVQSAALLLFGVFALKAALLPLTLWLPAAYAHTSAPVAALFAIMTKVGAYSILRVYSLIAGERSGPLVGLLDAWLMPAALATLAFGMLGTLASVTLRQQVAYLVVASIGSLLVAFGLGSADALAAGLYYLPHTTFATAALFLLADSIARGRGDLGDRFESGPAMPRARLVGGLFFAAAIAAAGLPPLSGFLGKVMLLQAALESPHLAWVWGVVLATGLAGVIALARSGSLLFYRTHGAHNTVLEAPTNAALAPVVALLALIVGLVVAAGPLSAHAAAIAAQITAPQGYIDAVLGGAR